jgi:hypothetical protein
MAVTVTARPAGGHRDLARRGHGIPACPRAIMISAGGAAGATVDWARRGHVAEKHEAEGPLSCGYFEVLKNSQGYY